MKNFIDLFLEKGLIKRHVDRNTDQADHFPRLGQYTGLQNEVGNPLVLGNLFQVLVELSFHTILQLFLYPNSSNIPID